MLYKGPRFVLFTTLLTGWGLAACTAQNPRFQGVLDAGTADDGPLLTDALASGSGGQGADGGPWGTGGSPPGTGGSGQGAGGAGGSSDGPGPDVAAPVSPLGHWRFDDGAPSTTASDSSGNGAPGRLARSAEPAALHHRRLALPHGHQRPVPGALVSQQMGTTSDEVFSLCIVADELMLYLPRRTGVDHGVGTDGTLPLNVWIHVAATFDGQSARIYRDGQLVATRDYPYPLTMSDRPVHIGTNVNASTQQPFVGLLAEVMIYGEALPAAAIGELARP